jgi:hypothetical protein
MVRDGQWGGDTVKWSRCKGVEVVREQSRESRVDTNAEFTGTKQDN